MQGSECRVPLRMVKDTRVAEPLDPVMAKTMRRFVARAWGSDHSISEKAGKEIESEMVAARQGERKATEQARKDMIRVPLREGRTLHHDINGRYGAGRVSLRNAPPGTGIIAGGPMRAVFEALGVQDVVAKSIGTSNAHNMVKATFQALSSCVSPRQIAAKRGKKVGDIVGRRDDGKAKEQEDG